MFKNDFKFLYCPAQPSVTYSTKRSSCDGIGGNIKRCAANESLRRSPNEAIVSAAHMFEFCTKTFPSIIIEIITAQDISKDDENIIGPP